MFLQFWLISASRSYKHGSYKKKRVLNAEGADAVGRREVSGKNEIVKM